MAGTLDVPTMRILMESGTDWWMFSATVGTALLGAWALYTAPMRAAKEQFGSTMAHLVGQEKAQERQHRHQLKVMRAAIKCWTILRSTVGASGPWASSHELPNLA